MPRHRVDSDRLPGIVRRGADAVDLADTSDVDDEIAGWLRAAYDQAGY